ncbi:hypothetical protein [Paenibacillus donghaensis]|uniref:Uncharacterized protein n=1 Tax=Paenibacillus donghaensis TaxID=414771 RepID=A0A2Z2KAW1_9BACL|nr:hypothetical protein [Paenibacillus donghaensis]ASA22647.1 hypothetical protein B9T62_18745 [Paenibacillus donghaensis]
MNRYILFGFDAYYPSGGLNDIVTAFNTIEDVKRVVNDCDYQYYQILDMKNGAQYSSYNDDENEECDEIKNQTLNELNRWIEKVIYNFE